MDLSHITSQSLRRILSLTERKDELVKLVSELESEIAKVFSIRTAPAAKSRARKPARARKSGKRAASRKSNSRRKPTPLKARILSLLDEAGSQGMRVRDIAAKLGIAGGNVSVWIGTTGKKLLSKVGPGVYALKGTKSAAASPAKSVPVKKAAKAGKKTNSRVKKTFKRSKNKGWN